MQSSMHCSVECGTRLLLLFAHHLRCCVWPLLMLLLAPPVLPAGLYCCWPVLQLYCHEI